MLHNTFPMIGNTKICYDDDEYDDKDDGDDDDDTWLIITL